MLKKAPLYLLLLFLVPVILYGIFQISSLSEDEENIQLIYQNQLDAILFSVNQYSDDVVNDWILSVEGAMKKEETENALLPLLQVNPGIHLFFTADSLSGRISEVFPDSLRSSGLVQMADDSLYARRNALADLLAYSRSGYRKIESARLQSADSSSMLMLYFILNTPSPEGNRLGGFLIDPEQFIEINLAPRLQTIAQDKFIISAFYREQEEPVYSTMDSVAANPVDAMAITKDFWLLPDYFLGIDAGGTSVFDIIQERMLLNVGLLILMLLILSVGLILIYRNIKKELRLAQNKSEFVSNVSHEFRTPLALISMFAETLEMGRVRSDEKKREYYQIIHKESARLTGMVNKILTFSQIDANKKEFHPENTELNMLTDDILDTYSFHLEQKGFTCKREMRTEEIFVSVDTEAMQEVIINLLHNALKYSGDSKEIDVITGTRNGQAFLTVRDYGIGISKEDQEKIFEKFFRVSTGDIAKSKGTGLGLSLVKYIVEQHGGKVEVESRPGKGSAFTVYLPETEQHNG